MHLYLLKTLIVTKAASTRFVSADGQYLLQVRNSATCTPRTDSPKRHFHPNTSSSVVPKLDLREGISLFLATMDASDPMNGGSFELMLITVFI